MAGVDVLVIAVLLLSFVAGLKQGAVTNLFSLVALLVAIPLTGIYYYLVSTVITFLPDANWDNFFGFFTMLAAIALTLQLVFFLLRNHAENVWEDGASFRLVGGAMSLLRAGITLELFALVLAAYPVVDSLEKTVASSAIINWLTGHVGFVAAMLPDTFQKTSSILISY